MRDYLSGKCLGCTYGPVPHRCDGFTFPLATYRCSCTICREREEDES